MAQAADAATPAQQPDTGASGGPSSYQASPPHGAEILSDTRGVDFTDYLRRIKADIQHNWLPLIPAEANAPKKVKGVVVIRFTILPDGRIGMMKLEARSGDVELDKAAWHAITAEGMFPSLPREFHGPQLELRFGFFYNTPAE
jgi:TonB family protein